MAPRLTAPVEEGDSVHRVITGIESTSYTVAGLLTDEYEFRVKAVAANGNQSDWSNIELVTLADHGPVYEVGDVNNDGNITIGDVTALINYLLSGGDINTVTADVNGDQGISIGDVTALINKLLNSAN